MHALLAILRNTFQYLVWTFWNLWWFSMCLPFNQRLEMKSDLNFKQSERDRTTIDTINLLSCRMIQSVLHRFYWMNQIYPKIKTKRVRHDKNRRKNKTLALNPSSLIESECFVTRTIIIKYKNVLLFLISLNVLLWMLNVRWKLSTKSRKTDKYFAYWKCAKDENMIFILKQRQIFSWHTKSDINIMSFKTYCWHTEYNKQMEYTDTHTQSESAKY